MIEIIPAIDIIEGKCVRLAQGDFATKKIYSENPLEIARQFAAANLKRLHIVDLDGAKNGAVVNLKVLETIARNTDLKIDFGGGIKTDADLEAVFNAGALTANVGSLAVKNPARFEGWLNKYGGEKILLGADVKNERIVINGWQTATEIEILPFLKNYSANGGTRAFVTDVAKDGLLQGAAVELYAKILREIPELKLIASGGVSKIEDIKELEKIGCAGAIVGKAIYEGKISLKSLSEEMKPQMNR